MEIIILLFSVLAVPLALIVVYYIMTVGIFICEEINHSLRKAKRDLQRDLWQLEWNLKHH